MKTPGYCIAACWMLFVVFWGVSALSAKRAAERRSWASSLAYRIPIVLGAILSTTQRLPPPLQLRWTVPEAGYVGAAVCVLGVLGAIWSRVTLAGNWSSDVTFKEAHVLVERGPYQFVRHPIYTSILLMCLGSIIAFGHLGSWLGLGLIFAGLWIKLRQEEILLTRHFPDTYPAYKARVKALVPFLF